MRGWGQLITAPITASASAVPISCDDADRQANDAASSAAVAAMQFLWKPSSPLDQSIQNTGHLTLSRTLLFASADLGEQGCEVAFGFSL